MSADLVDIDARPIVAIELAATVLREQGRPVLRPAEPARWHALLGSLCGMPVTVSVARAKRGRSLAQNRYLWGAVYPHLLEGFRAIAADAGEACPFLDAEHVHEAMKHRFLGVDVLRLPGGETIEAPPSTARLTTAQFVVYVEQIGRWAAERGIYIPQPNE